MQLKILFFFLFAELAAAAQHGQHDMQHMNMGDSMQMDAAMPMDHQMEGKGMNHSYSLSLPMSRDGSGTSWSPDNNPMYMVMAHERKGMWMFHGSIFLRYTNQELSKQNHRGGQALDAPNWFMAMYNRQAGKNGLFNFTGMFSLDALTVGNRGYPLLFQSGESYKGVPIVDRQHPHDLFSALSIAYTQRLSRQVDVFGYIGYPGEPPISAPTFMHRISAMNDPDATLGHHWQDATHITFGVVTAGIRAGKVKAEVSAFTGREPDEHRYDFDPIRLNSYAWRLSFNPSKAWALQVSQAFIKSPELLHPQENIWRYTASALYTSPVNSAGSYYSTALVWGMNDAGSNHRQHSVLLEATRQLKKLAIYGRYEFVQKSSEELNLETAFGQTVFNIHKLGAGTNHTLFKAGKLEVLGGLQAAVHAAPKALEPLYGSTPLTGEVYLQLRPGLMK